MSSLHDTKFGAPQLCPDCGHSNPSGLPLPERCMWCGPYGTKHEIKELSEMIKRQRPKEYFMKSYFGGHPVSIKLDTTRVYTEVELDDMFFNKARRSYYPDELIQYSCEQYTVMFALCTYEKGVI